MNEAKNKTRRRHSAELKQQILAECAQPGASVASQAAHPKAWTEPVNSPSNSNAHATENGRPSHTLAMLGSRPKKEAEYDPSWRQHRYKLFPAAASQNLYSAAMTGEVAPENWSS